MEAEQLTLSEEPDAEELPRHGEKRPHRFSHVVGAAVITLALVGAGVTSAHATPDRAVQGSGTCVAQGGHWIANKYYQDYHFELNVGYLATGSSVSIQWSNKTGTWVRFPVQSVDYTWDGVFVGNGYTDRGFDVTVKEGVQMPWGTVVVNTFSGSLRDHITNTGQFSCGVYF